MPLATTRETAPPKPGSTDWAVGGVKSGVGRLSGGLAVWG
jgi:hypothetical protein